jgi:hypothetical protein
MGLNRIYTFGGSPIKTADGNPIGFEYLTKYLFYAARDNGGYPYDQNVVYRYNMDLQIVDGSIVQKTNLDNDMRGLTALPFGDRILVNSAENSQASFKWDSISQTDVSARIPFGFTVKEMFKVTDTSILVAASDKFCYVNPFTNVAGTLSTAYGFCSTGIVADDTNFYFSTDSWQGGGIKKWNLNNLTPTDSSIFIKPDTGMILNGDYIYTAREYSSEFYKINKNTMTRDSSLRWALSGVMAINEETGKIYGLTTVPVSPYNTYLSRLDTNTMTIDASSSQRFVAGSQDQWQNQRGLVLDGKIYLGASDGGYHKILIFDEATLTLDTSIRTYVSSSESQAIYLLGIYDGVTWK